MTVALPPPETKSPQTATQRRDMILERLQKYEVVRVKALAQSFGVSEVTIRADLIAMEAEGLLRREHGGAVRARGSNTLLTSLSGMDERASLRTQEKERIAAAAAQRVQPGDTILLDAGTTVVEMIPFLGDVPNLTIVTHALNVAAAVGSRLRCRLIVLGGDFSRESCSNLGPQALQALAEFNVSKLFLGTQAFDVESGLTDTTLEIAQIKRAMIDAAQQVILLADSSKWEKTGFIKVAPISSLHRIISDSALPTSAVEAIQTLGPVCDLA